MMKVGFLKRLESSVHSFEITMGRTIGKIESLEKKIRNFIANPEQNPELDELELDLQEPDEEELEASRLVGGKFKYRLEDLELDSGKNWLKDLQGDKQQLSLFVRVGEGCNPRARFKAARTEKADRTEGPQSIYEQTWRT